MEPTRRPTEKQLAAWFHLTKWALLREEQLEALDFMGKHFTRAEASRELHRVRSLCINHKLNKDNALDSPTWRKYKEDKNAK